MKKNFLLPVVAVSLCIVGGKNVLATPEVYSAVNVVSRENEQVQLPKEIVSLDNKATIVKETIQWNIPENQMFSQAGSYEVYGKTENNNKVKGVINVFPKNQKVKIAAVGDSITYGMNVENVNVNSYPRQLNQRLGHDYEVGNFGHSARTLLAQGDLPYLKSPEYKKSLDFAPNVVVLQLGTNDTKTQNMKKIDDFVNDYVNLINSYKNLKTKPVVYISLPPHVFKTAYGITQNNLDKILPKIFEVAKAADVDVSIIDNFTETDYAADLIPDGVHPNARGAAILANNVYYNLKGEAPLISEKTALNDYYKTYGGLNVNNSGSLEIQNLATDNWVSFKNVKLNGNDLQLFLSVPYDNTKVVVRSGNEKGKVLGEKVLTKTGSTYNYQTVPLNKAQGVQDITIVFERDKSSKTAEIVKLAKADFFYDSEKPLDISSFTELETAVKNNISKIKLSSDIKLSRRIELSENTTIDLNGYTLDTAGYYIGKDEKSGKKVELSLLNGNLLGKYGYGSIYAANSIKNDYGLNITFEDIIFEGSLSQRTFTPGSIITEKGKNNLNHSLSSSNTLVYSKLNLNNNKGAVQFYAAVPYDNTIIKIRKSSNTGEIVGEKQLVRTGSINKLAYHTVELDNISAEEDLFLTVERKGTNGYTELMRLEKADFNYDSNQPIEVSSYDELETAIQSNMSNIRLNSSITLAKRLDLIEDLKIDLNSYTLDTANYYIGKDEKAGKRINLSLLNGNLSGKYSNGSIYTSNSTRENYGLNVSFENILFDGKVTQTNFSPNTMIVEKGQNQLVHALSSSNTLVYTDVDTSNGSLDLYGAVPYTNTYITIRKGTENGELVGEKLLDRTGSINKDATHSIPLTNVSEQEDLFIKVERKGANGYTELMRVK